MLCAMRDDGLLSTDPDCPACGARCYPTRTGSWICRSCDLPHLGVGIADLLEHA